MLVSSQIESPIITIGAAEFCEGLWNVCVSCHPSLCKCGTGNLQLLVWLLLVKLRVSQVIISVCVLYNFPVNKITLLIFFVWMFDQINSSPDCANFAAQENELQLERRNSFYWENLCPLKVKGQIEFSQWSAITVTLNCDF